MPRPWGFWTEHKLDLLSDYLTAFNIASSKKARGTTVYIDLFAGQVENISQTTLKPIEGSPIRALRTVPPFTRLVLFEMPRRAAALRAHLTKLFPGRDFRVYEDCNAKIDEALADLADLRWAPTFAFADQQSTELRWESLEKLARHKRGSKYKVELWMLFAHSQLPRGLGVKRETDEQFAQRIDNMLGTSEWRAAYAARRRGDLSGEQFRDELANWMRWRLENVLGYKATHAFELRNENKTPVYTMIFATDNSAGNDIMNDLYARAAVEHGEMREQAVAIRRAREEESSPTPGLFPPLVRTSSIPPEELYVPAPPRAPYGLGSSQTSAS